MQMYVDGRWHAGSDGERIPVINPARTSEIVGSIPDGTAIDIDVAVTAAKRAQLEWARLPLAERAAMVAEAGAQLAATDPSAPETLTREMGKILAESVMDFQSPPWAWSHYLNDLDALDRVLTDRRCDDTGRLEVRRRPVGVVGAIVPWNWPITLLGVKLGPALLAGNTIVAVPSPFASLGVLKAIEQAKRDDIKIVFGGAGAKGMVKTIMDGKDKRIGADVSYSPKFIYDAIKLTAEARLKGEKLPATTIIPSVLITKENAKDFYHPNSPF
jgi:aldehyde dehydrogenase